MTIFFFNQIVKILKAVLLFDSQSFLIFLQPLLVPSAGQMLECRFMALPCWWFSIFKPAACLLTYRHFLCNSHDSTVFRLLCLSLDSEHKVHPLPLFLENVAKLNISTLCDFTKLLRGTNIKHYKLWHHPGYTEYGQKYHGNIASHIATSFLKQKQISIS